MYNYTCIIWYPKKDNVRSGINKKRSVLRSVSLCGLTDSPTSCPWEGSAVGLEPTAHRMGNLSRQGRESNPSPCQFQQLLPRSHRAYEREVNKFGVGQFPWPLGLSPCCDYIVSHLCRNVNTFLRKNKKNFLKKNA